MYLKMHPFFTHGVQYNEESCTETLLINTILALLFFYQHLFCHALKVNHEGGWS